MLTSEVLDLAADHIQQYGHIKGQGHGSGDIATAPACVIGAVGAVQFIHREVCSRDDYYAALDAMHEQVATPTLSIPDWSDAPERTAEEVIAAFRAAAVIQAAREQQDAAWATYAEVVTA